MNSALSITRPAAIASSTAVETHDLRKSFDVAGKPVDAVRGVDLEVRAGEVFGFLGPNGAGKTTTLRMLTTLLAIDSGQAVVAGLDVAHDPARVRRRIGYVSQLGGADRPATGRENLLLQGELYGMSKATSSARAGELIDVFELGAFIDRRVLTYSGGQRRRVEVALGIMHRPEILFLDEPTTGLDPQARRRFWELVESIKARRKTIILSTHYMEEAELLCDEIAIMDGGRIVAQGPPRTLLREHFAEVLLELPRQEFPERAHALPLRMIAAADRVEITTDDLDGTLRVLLDARVSLSNLRIRPPNLEDLFLTLTGKELRA
jgi:ABC-2 type transport system ATP-binding protein